jgi:heme/copper-type cytochrome/quinol oxidase subunit 1
MNLSIKQRPYHLLLLTSLILLILSFFQKQTIDIHVHDTYYVIAKSHFYLMMAFITGLLWLFYLATRTIIFSKTLSWIHIICTILSIGFFLWLLNSGNNLPASSQGGYLDLSMWNSFNDHGKHMQLIKYLIVVFFMGQLLLFINSIAGFVLKLAKR